MYKPLFFVCQSKLTKVSKTQYIRVESGVIHLDGAIKLLPSCQRNATALVQKFINITIPPQSTMDHMTYNFFDEYSIKYVLWLLPWFQRLWYWMYMHWCITHMYQIYRLIFTCAPTQHSIWQWRCAMSLANLLHAHALYHHKWTPTTVNREPSIHMVRNKKIRHRESKLEQISTPMNGQPIMYRFITVITCVPWLRHTQSIIIIITIVYTRSYTEGDR